MIEQICDATPVVLIVDGTFADTGAHLAKAAPSIKALLYAGTGAPPAKAFNYEAALAAAQPGKDAVRDGEELACIFLYRRHHGPFERRDAQPCE
jgi:long-chain acyl-CoA synthetase